MTIQKFYLPDGISTQNKGVVSDVPLPSHREFLPIGEADLPKAMLWDKINPVNSAYPDAERSGNFQPIDESFKSRLRDLSEARQIELEEFSFLKKSISVFKERQETKAFSLNLEKRLQIKETDKLVREELETREDELEKHFFPSEKIVLGDPPATPATAITGEDPLSADQVNVEPVEGTPPEEEDDGPGLDIHLRESLRILSDWIDASNLKGVDTAAAAKREKRISP